MDDFSSREFIEKIEFTLKKIINEVLNNLDSIDNLEVAMTQTIHAKIGDFSRSLSFNFHIPDGIDIKNISYSPKTSSNGIIKGDIIIEHCKKRDVCKYGSPGYPGKEDGQLCEYPEHSRKFYKWNSSSCRWVGIYKNINRGNDRQSWSDKLTQNAAFEPWWGTNTSGSNYPQNNRKPHGTGDLWADPGVRSYMGTFKQISADVMQSIYSFTLNLKSAIGYYEKLSDVFGFGNDKNNTSTSNNNQIYTAEEEPKVTITIEKVNNWHYFYNNGHIDQSGNSVRKDTVIFPEDSSSIRQRIEKENEAKRKKGYEIFKNKN